MAGSRWGAGQPPMPLQPPACQAGRKGSENDGRVDGARSQLEAAVTGWWGTARAAKQVMPVASYNPRTKTNEHSVLLSVPARGTMKSASHPRPPPRRPPMPAGKARGEHSVYTVSLSPGLLHTSEVQVQDASWFITGQTPGAHHLKHVSYHHQQQDKGAPRPSHEEDTADCLVFLPRVRERSPTPAPVTLTQTQGRPAGPLACELPSSKARTGEDSVGGAPAGRDHRQEGPHAPRGHGALVVPSRDIG